MSPDLNILPVMILPIPPILSVSSFTKRGILPTERGFDSKLRSVVVVSLVLPQQISYPRMARIMVTSSWAPLQTTYYSFNTHTHTHTHMCFIHSSPVCKVVSAWPLWQCFHWYSHKNYVLLWVHAADIDQVLLYVHAFCPVCPFNARAANRKALYMAVW